MRQKKPLRQREKELQSLLKSSEGRAELENLASRYGARSGKPWSGRTSVITYIIVHERVRGLIVSEPCLVFSK